MERDDDADAERIGEARRQPRPCENRRQPRAERGAGKRAGQHADQRDADLHRGQEFAGIFGQVEGRTGAATP